jgi:outer membrane protein OmpA-like peptidoglycan-associated protein
MCEHTESAVIHILPTFQGCTMLIPFLFSTVIFASPEEFPDINVQYFRPAIDSQHFVWVNESATPKTGAITFRSFLSYSSRPLIYTDSNKNVTDVLQDLYQLDLVGGYGFGNLRIGVDIPFVLKANGSLPSGEEYSESSIGDVAVDLKYRVTKEDAPLGVSVSLRGQVPVSQTNAAISSSEPIIEGEISVDTQQDKIHVAANIGHREQANFSYERSLFGSQVYLRGGLGYLLDNNKGVSMEFVTARLYEYVDKSDAFSSEAMMGGWMTFEPLVVRGGVGMGIGAGIGTPEWRTVISMEYLPSKVIHDRDRDGIVDASDQCPTKPEDMDGVLDDDGCPDDTQVTIVFVDQFGARVSRKKWSDGELEGYSGVPFLSKARQFMLTADLEGFLSVQQNIVVLDGDPQDIEVPVERILGTVQVIAKTSDGDIIPNAVWSISGADERFDAGTKQAVVPEEHFIEVMAQGYKLGSTKVRVSPEENRVVVVELKSTKAQVKDGRINLEGVIHFQTNSATIVSSSFVLLKDVADILRDFPAIELIRIEGHTDSDGEANMNKYLSQSRAESVRRFLMGEGIEEDRMLAVGLGEENPIASNRTTKGKKSNRRVEIHIVNVDQSKVEGVHDFDFHNDVE